MSQGFPRTGWDAYTLPVQLPGGHSNARSPTCMLGIDRSLLHVLWLIVTHRIVQCQVVLSRSHRKHLGKYLLPCLVPSHTLSSYITNELNDMQ